VRDARRAPHEENPLATYRDQATATHGGIANYTAVGEPLRYVEPEQLVAAVWGNGFRHAVVAEAERGIVR
jgi:hypothetical protein